jgi:hypothetical protein
MWRGIVNRDQLHQQIQTQFSILEGAVYVALNSEEPSIETCNTMWDVANNAWASIMDTMYEISEFHDRDWPHG